jgi:FkbM family methyltransferase
MGLAISYEHLIPNNSYAFLRDRYFNFAHLLDPEIKLLPKLVNSRVCAVDIGANVGVWSYRLSKMFKKVESFEPIPECVKTMARILPENVNIHSVALGMERENKTLYVPFVKGKQAYGLASLSVVEKPHNQIKVEVHTLDEYELEKVTFIKIDVEGYELEVLKGASKTIKREKPVIVIEIEQRHLPYPMKTVVDSIAEYGYEGFFLCKNEYLPFSDFSYEKHQKPFLDLVNANFHVSEYVNNFIFTQVRNGT